MMLRQLLYLVIMAVTVFLAGCGQKGPLYLPDDPSATDRASVTAHGDTNRRQE